MSQFKFGNIDDLKRNRDIEGETGTEVALRGGIKLRLLCATDANPAWKQHGEAFRNELRRLARAGASDERVKKYLAHELTRLFVKGWEGVMDTEGNAIPWTKEACEAFLVEADDAIPAIQDIVYDTQNFRGQRIEAIVEAGKAS